MGQAGRYDDAPVLARARVLVSGRVQGVFFRASTAQTARTLGLAGFARNLPDGRVEAVFEGERGAVERAIDFCRTGPPHAQVADVEVSWQGPEAGGDGFRVR